MLKKILRITLAFVLLNLVFLFALVLFPSISYAHETELGEVMVYHNEPLPAHFIRSIEKSLKEVRQVEIYRETPKVQICVNDGAVYPDIIKKLLGDDVFRAFANKSVMIGEFTGPDLMSFGDREVNVTQFLSHALIHNLQYEYHGFWDANPLGRHAEWKWEGYVEYELLGKHRTLTWFADRLKESENEFSWVDFGNAKGTISRHLSYLMLVKYCMEEMGMSYDELMDSQLSGVEWQLELEAFLGGVVSF